MKKKISAFIFLCLSVLSLFGCRTEMPPSPRVVSSITVNWNRDGHSFTRHYTDMQKMEDILLYLRLVKPEEPPEIAPEVSDSVYTITVSLIDGQKHIYRQQHHRFFRREQEPWQTISPERATELYALLRRNKSDL